MMGVAALAIIPAWGQGAQAPRYSADIPAWITTPDTVETCIGTLMFHHGVLLRLHGPLEAWFDKSWKPGDIEQLQ